MIRVLVVDDHARMRRSIRMLLERSGDIEVVGEVEEGAKTLNKVKALQPDVVILDISMPDMNGFEVLKALRRLAKRPKVVMLSMNDSNDLIEKALQNGAGAYIRKHEAGSRLVPAVRQIVQGKGTELGFAVWNVTLALAALWGGI